MSIALPSALLDLGVHLYATTGASVESLAQRLLLDPPDLLAELERRGVHRSLAQNALTAEARQQRLDAIRRDRLAREGRPVSTAEEIRREVIASQRIEGVDARLWLPPAR